MAKERRCPGQEWRFELGKGWWVYPDLGAFGGQDITEIYDPAE
jgi:hypothetical protein